MYPIVEVKSSISKALVKIQRAAYSADIGCLGVL
jgi:hypothetical protein